MTNPIAVTMGDPSGIGPECVAKTWTHMRASDNHFFVIADPTLYHDLPVQIIEHPSEAAEVFEHQLPVIPLELQVPPQLGHPDPRNASAVVASIRQAVHLCQSGAASAVMTAPISKSILKEGTDFPYPGHTEFLAHLGGDVPVAMMLASEQLRVIPVTIHIPLSEVAPTLSEQAVFETITLADRELRHRFDIDQPRIAVAGLNPHAGENGHMGTEDQSVIASAIARAQAHGITVKGPLPADTMFHARARASYDVAICMYHDQALIPIKTLDFDRGVNVTLGLPFVRTSPDHGTAFDIAGKGVASAEATIEAIKLAAQLGKG